MNKIGINSLLLALLSTGCSTGSDRNALKLHVLEYEWKYDGGLNIGDWLNFSDGSYKLKNDTISFQDSAAAIVITIEIGYPGDDDEMQIMSIDGKEKGFYHSK